MDKPQCGLMGTFDMLFLDYLRSYLPIFSLLYIFQLFFLAWLNYKLFSEHKEEHQEAGMSCTNTDPSRHQVPRLPGKSNEGVLPAAGASFGGHLGHCTSSSTGQFFIQPRCITFLLFISSWMLHPKLKLRSLLPPRGTGRHGTAHNKGSVFVSVHCKAVWSTLVSWRI